MGNLDNALVFFKLRMQLGKQLYDSNLKNESLKNSLAISYQNLGLIYEDLGQTDKVFEYLELYNHLMKQLYDSNPKNVELKNGLAISYYKLGTIYQNEIQVKLQYQTAINLWQEIYDLIRIKSNL